MKYIPVLLTAIPTAPPCHPDLRNQTNNNNNDVDEWAAAVHLCVSTEAGLQDVGEFGVPEGDVKSVAPQSAEHLQQEAGTTQTCSSNINDMSCWGRH